MIIFLHQPKRLAHGNKIILCSAEWILNCKDGKLEGVLREDAVQIENTGTERAS